MNILGETVLADLLSGELSMVMQDLRAIRYYYQARQAVYEDKAWSDHTLLSPNYQVLNLTAAFCLAAFSVLVIAQSCAAEDKTTNGKSSTVPIKPATLEVKPEDPMTALACDASFNKAVMAKVNSTILESFYSKEIGKKVWPDALEKQKDRILSAKNLLELSEGLNAAIDELKTSHCKFLTINDDTFYFLNSLFHLHRQEPKAISVFPGFITGGAGFDAQTVRFVLDGSPAAKAGILVADKILTVNGFPFVGQANYFGADRARMSIVLSRQGKQHEFQFAVRKGKMYDMYVDAVEKSPRRFEKDGLQLGYIRLWCGGQRAQEEMEAQLDEEPLKSCDGLILDLRDGYGACSLDALDPFYRQPAAYPDFEMTMRNGKKKVSRSYFDKPMVAIINGGSRSGKEMLAFSLKKTNRAKVIGDTTAGFFVAGKLFPINEKCALYLAIEDCSLSGVRLEGTGVEPEMKVENNKTSSHDHQLEIAKEELIKRIRQTQEKEEAKTSS